MITSPRCVALFLTLLFAASVNADAATIFLSGDVNILTSLDGSFGDVVNPGNQQFFKNILGSGTHVVIHDASAAPFSGALINTVNTFYSSLSGVSSSVLSGSVTSAALSGANLFISMLPGTEFSAEAVLALSTFGGDILFIGDSAEFPEYVADNTRINAALSGLGSSMSLLSTTFGRGGAVARGSQIAADDPYTLGITAFSFSVPSEISVGRGKALVFGRRGEPFVGYEVVGVPESASLILIGLGLGGLSFVRRNVRL